MHAAGIEVLECTLCGERFTEQAVRENKFFPSTGVCLKCYERGQSNRYSTWCFGKPNVIGSGGTILQYGYDETAAACLSECPDRAICKLFVGGKLGEKGGWMGKQKELVCPFKQSQSMTARAWMMCASKGVMIQALVTWVKKQGGDPRRILRIMRSGRRYNVRWSVQESNGFLKIHYEVPQQ